MIDFPPLETAGEDGLLAIGGDINPTSLLFAYRRGIFPWPVSESDPVLWFAPDPRSVIDTTDFHLPRTLAKILKQEKFKITFNKNFSQVIQRCAMAKRREQNGTWITQDMINGYIKLYHLGYAYSIEVLSQDRLVGGMYGVNIGGFFSGESMFFEEPNASKVALVSLLQLLCQNHIPFLDIQMTTPVTESLGAKKITRQQFMSELSSLVRLNVKVF